MVCLEKSSAYKMNIYYSSVGKVSNSRNFSFRGDLEASFLFPDEEKQLESQQTERKVTNRTTEDLQLGPLVCDRKL